MKKISEKSAQIGWAILSVGGIWVGFSFLVDRHEAFFNYLVMFMFLLSVAVGSLFLVALEYVANASWSTPLRRIPEALSGLLPILAVLAIPLALGLHELYHWTHADAMAADEILQGKRGYLNIPFFIIRVATCLAIWCLVRHLLLRNSLKQDANPDQTLTARNIKISAVFMPLFAITLSVAAFDWLMTLEPHWYSTMFGVYYFAGTVGVTLAVITLIVVPLRERGYLHPALTRDHYYSLGALMFAFTCFWAYIAFSQTMLIWYANLPEETFWFVNRWRGSWQYVTMAIFVLRFIIPFFTLLSQDAKTSPRVLIFISVWIVAVHLLDLYWIIMPTYYKESATVTWQMGGFVAVAVGLIVVVFSRFAARHPLVPLHDPKLQKGLGFHL